MLKIEDIFGVSGKQVGSYIERDHVDAKLIDALRTEKQIIVYGASKQGKTALVKKYITYDDHILISLSPTHTLKDIYQSILRKCNVVLKTSYTEGTGEKYKATGKASIQGAVALIAKVNASFTIQDEKNTSNTEHYDEIEFNLDLPDDVAYLIHHVGSKKIIILENFHYLPEEIQRAFAFDLRTFHDLKVRFIILGVWKEANRLTQFNGELQDRISEIPVEPWLEADFRSIAKKGGDLLNIDITPAIIEKCISNSFGSVGVFQELLKGSCIADGILTKQETTKHFINIDAVNTAIAMKTNEYSGRHLRNLETMAVANSASITKGNPLPYFLNYYIVMHILSLGYHGVNGGISKENILHALKQVHHRKDELKGHQLVTALKSLTGLQASKGITPPVIAYDSNSRQLKIVDSTFYFFLKNSDLEEVKSEIPCPMDGLDV
ncbi:TPA: hypothetical protein U2R10_002943 [Proteus mirabilis]|uniref:hypothetical protein n=1 Tax=Enterobacterales TaxID=91347 RepID=UPI000B400A1D|nr:MULTISPECIES: hypothetical protein [Proteus]ARX08618.1 hypothetical protein AM405_07000 [Proteus mirabilis]EIM6941407.1 hypothetical protein [Proteus mirabilis]EIO2234456.1 hypothetical protein [Proteus mirabilis]EJD6537296.1 hypothetical protein [Proteus mirabilis]EKU0058497.1 hypothetical protein [Proteus mirabilis]